MTDPRSPLAAAQNGQLAAEEAQREERHQRLATLLAAFADGELPAETVSQIDAHLLGCSRCRNELQVHRSLRTRLEAEPLPAASAALRSRIMTAIAAAPAPQWETVAETATDVVVETPAAPAPTTVRFGRVFAIVAALAGAAVLAMGGWLVVERTGFTGRTDTVVSASSVPLVSAALADYRKVMQGDLPGRGRDLGAVRGAMSFPVQPIQSDRLRLLAAWTTTLNGEPAAVLAYSADEHVVLQYIVSELELYRPAELRSVLAGGRMLAAHDGNQSVVAWPDADAGSLVIADLPLPRLESLHSIKP